jgi:periplasmic protein TonB
MVTGRRVIGLSISVGLHLAAMGVGLLVGGADAGYAILVDLVTDAGQRAHDAPTIPRVHTPRAGAGRVETASARPVPRVIVADRAAVPSGPPPERLTASPARPAAEEEREPARAATILVAPGARPNVEASAEPAPMGTVADIQAGSVASREAARRTGNESGDVARGAADHAAAPASEAMRSQSAGSIAGAGGVSPVGGAGSPLAAASPGGVPDAMPAEYGPYLDRFRRRVSDSLGYPLAARRQGLSGTVEVEVVLEPSGRLSAVRLVSSSSHAVLDEAALLAVKGLSPEPFPDLLPRRPLRIRLPLTFELR